MDSNAGEEGLEGDAKANHQQGIKISDYLCIIFVAIRQNPMSARSAYGLTIIQSIILFLYHYNLIEKDSIFYTSIKLLFDLPVLLMASPMAILFPGVFEMFHDIVYVVILFLYIIISWKIWYRLSLGIARLAQIIQNATYL